MENQSWIVKVLATLGGVCCYLWGPWDALIVVLLACVVIDYLSGLASAAVRGELDSSVGFKGLLKKIFIFVLVAVATLVDTIIPATNSALRATVILFYIANESLSVLENAGEIGLPLPKPLKQALMALKKHTDPDADGEEKDR